jgi:hypothetical protein
VAPPDIWGQNRAVTSISRTTRRPASSTFSNQASVGYPTNRACTRSMERSSSAAPVPVRYCAAPHALRAVAGRV